MDDHSTNKYEEERVRQMRENELFLASLQIEKPVEFKPKAQRKARNKENDDDEFRPKREYEIRKRTHTISYREESINGSFDWPKKNTNRPGHKGTRNSNPGIRRVGGRLYDPVKGSTCHQCRQKTTDEKICCTSDGCNVMFDIHCLNIRYEDEADRTKAAGKVSSWVCPKCTGKCNCSFCRRKQNKRPTGQLTVFIKNNGVDVAMKDLSCDGFSSSTLYPKPPTRAKRAHSIDNMYMSENDYEDDAADSDVDDGEGGEGNDDGSYEGKGRGGRAKRALTGRRYSQRQTKAYARQKIAALATSDDSDIERLYFGGENRVGRVWKGWELVPSHIDCVVLI
ncbi:hypothetical protein FB645_001466 [Coemansia sp. IMI 203386]|nr:hypothetical protein FB645_001466 [Coemansia sp. IMI 203386]